MAASRPEAGRWQPPRSEGEDDGQEQRKAAEIVSRRRFKVGNPEDMDI
ncbi:MAG: hypothetical protein K6A65_06525 [Succinivibrionaceae bacterium]|nr:hypothetical protein [Succinivibrionaceae bacterium]